MLNLAVHRVTARLERVQALSLLYCLLACHLYKYVNNLRKSLLDTRFVQCDRVIWNAKLY
jgi:hypothetical protein